ncbi:GtrA family protein [Enterococcus timonensis]|uniref:GtrA family protein n=1 Tax=Enterococcus timonensis TaxID=1852364 RepID=UPI0008D8F63C|nr:GtrA family protein [Enterococcus timonensis]
MLKIFKILEKNRQLLTYLFFGGLTTVVNYAVYFLTTYLTGWDYRLINFLAWFFSVLFAYVVNKVWVFQTGENRRGQKFWREISLFFGARIFSLGLDMLLMIALISGLSWSDFWAKTLTQVVIVVTNYFLSKKIIFKK